MLVGFVDENGSVVNEEVSETTLELVFMQAKNIADILENEGVTFERFTELIVEVSSDDKVRSMVADAVSKILSHRSFVKQVAGEMMKMILS